MKFLLVEPPHRTRVSNFLIPNFGLAYLAACLRRAGHEARVFTSYVHPQPEQELSREIDDFAPDVVSFSAPTYKVQQAARMAAQVKRMRPGIKTLVGGWHITALPQETLAENSAFDLGIYGEGEDSIVELATSLANGGSLTAITGLVWREGHEIVVNPPRPQPVEVNKLPRPAWDLFPFDKLAPMYRPNKPGALDLPILGQRGCPHRCSFCQRVTGEKLRLRDLDDVFAELHEGLDRYQADGVQFFDETFTVSKKRVRAVCERMLADGLDRRIRWNCTGRVDTVDKETLMLMRQAGCRVILLGLESASESILSLVGKDTTLQQGRDAVRWCREAGILTDVSFVIGLPFDDRNSIRKTVAYSRQVDPDFVSYFTFIPYPGTEAAKLAEKGEANLRLLNINWEKYNPQLYPPCELQDVPAWQLVVIRFVAYARFYFRPRKFGNLLSMFSLKSIPQLLISLLGDLGGGRKGNGS